MENGKGSLAPHGDGYPDQLRESTPSPPPPYRPALPPRASDRLSPNDIPHQKLYHSQPTTLSWSDQDPRSASTESLVPPGSPRGKRTLLIIYIHGFLGDETSFQSFPAHVHNVVTGLVQDTHVVHTKIYPRYRSRRAIQYARDEFSKWLAPHESSDTDVILCGHSMGGLLSGEVALLPNPYPQGSNALMHRLVGTVNFDVPFLGMHPGVIGSGISSLFRPTPKSPEATTANPIEQIEGGPSTTSVNTMTTQDSRPQSISTMASGQSGSTLSLPQHDPNYDPPFVNDNNLPIRKGWDSTIHFLTKHSDHLFRASKSYVTSHLEFGGAMADYKGLQTRYKALRALADRENQHKPVAGTNKSTGLVRFVNYYTASTGIPKPERQGRTTPTGRKSPGQSTTQLAESSPSLAQRSPSASPRLSAEAARTSEDAAGVRTSPSHSRSGSSVGGDLATVEPIPHEPEKDEPEESIPTEASEAAETTDNNTGLNMPQETPESTTTSYPELPPLPTLPERPAEFDPAAFTDKDSRKVAEKDHQRQMKAYNQALKDRDKAVKERSKILEKREKAAKAASQKEEKRAKVTKKELEKTEKEKEKARDKEQKEKENAEQPADDTPAADAQPKEEKKKKDRKFCLLPPKARDGTRDPMWVRVFMVNVDEVGAHCGLFAAERPHYEGLVHDVSALMETWVREADNERVAGANLARASLAG